MRALVVAMLVALAGTAQAAPSASDPLDDAAGVVDDAAEPALVEELVALRGEVDIAVILVDTTGSVRIETYARTAAKKWSTGRTAAAVVVLAIKDRKSRLEVSDALRTKFPDARAQNILDNAKGYLRTGDYPSAIRAILREIKGAVTGVAPDLESPHPESDPTTLPALPSTTLPTPPPTSDEPSQSSSKSSTPWVAILVVIGVLLGFGAIWAAASRRASMSLSHDGAKHERHFVLDMLWCTAKIVGVIVYVAAIVAMASGTTRSSSSRSWSSGSSSGGSSSSGGGWSGGGASSSW